MEQHMPLIILVTVIAICFGLLFIWIKSAATNYDKSLKASKKSDEDNAAELFNRMRRAVFISPHPCGRAEWTPIEVEGINVTLKCVWPLSSSKGVKEGDKQQINVFLLHSGQTMFKRKMSA